MNKSIVRSLAVVIFFLAGCITVYNPATGKREMHVFSEKYEIKLGSNLAKQIVARNKMVDDPKSLAYVRKIGERVAAVSHRSYLGYKFYIIDSSEINAFALLGGHIFVNKGLLDTFGEPELAFVLGHEIGHVCARHGFKRFQAALGLQLIMTALSGQPNHRAINSLIAQVDEYVSLGFSRQDEYLADSLGVTYAYRAGFDPKASLNVFDRFLKIEKEQGSAVVPVFLRSHPRPKDRYAAINLKIKELAGTDAEDSSSTIDNFLKIP